MSDTIRVHFVGGPADGEEEDFKKECLGDTIIVPQITIGGRIENRYRMLRWEDDPHALYYFWQGNENTENSG